MSHNEYKRDLESGKWVRGPGGWHCSCCGPAPKDRKKARRSVRRKARQNINKDTER